MLKSKDRLILDTNLLISFLINDDYSTLDLILSKKKAILLFSKELVDKFIEVASRTKFRKYFSKNSAYKLLLSMNSFVDYIEVKSSVNICRDFKDNYLLNLAIDRNATHLLTGDKDLLILNKINNTEIITITDYLIKINK